MKNENPVFPPLPPPPPPSSLKLNLERAVAVTTSATSEHLGKRNLLEITRNIFHSFKDSHLQKIVCFLKPLTPVIQEGPSCGIAALTMASQIFNKNLTTDQVFGTAKSLKFTNKGEMFSAYNMATLATTLLDCEASVVANLFEHKSDILRNLANGWPVLIPYDADKNHEPCLRNGRSAHWAVLCGLCFSLTEDGHSLLDGYSCVQDIDYLYTISCNLQIEKLLKFASKLCIFAHQGKSRLLALWEYDSLLKSNNNLYEATDKYGIADMIVPSTGLSELNDKAVILKQRSS